MTTIKELTRLYDAATDPGEIRMHPADVDEWIDDAARTSSAKLIRVPPPPADAPPSPFPPGVCSYNGCYIIRDPTVPWGAPRFVSYDAVKVAESVADEVARGAKDLAECIRRAGADAPVRVTCGASNEVMAQMGAAPRGFRVTLVYERCDTPE